MINRTVLLSCLILLFAGSLRAQVNLSYEEFLLGEISPSSVASISVTNYTGVEIHYLFKGWVTDENGVEVLRVKSELLKHRSGRADFLEERGASNRLLNVDPFANLAIVQAAVGWKTYTGKLTLNGELVHPLDTFSIIARGSKEVYLKNGAFVTVEGQYVTDPHLAQLRPTIKYGELFELDKLSSYFRLENTNAHPHCGRYWITVQQGEDVVYNAELKQTCIPPGTHDLQADAFEVISDRYAERDLTAPLRISTFSMDSRSPGPRDSEFVPTYAHAQFDDEKVVYESRALGLSLQFYQHAEVSAMPADVNRSTIVFDEQGEIEEVHRPAYSIKPYPMPLDFPLGFHLGRGDLNGGVVTMVYDWNHLSAEDWTTYFAYRHNLDPAEVKKMSVDGLEIWYPGRLHNIRKLDAMRPPYDTFSIGIRDGDRFLIVSTSYVDPDGPFPLPVKRKPAYLISVPEIFASLNYHGLQFEPVLSPDGSLQEVQVNKQEEMPTVAERAAIFRQYALYASLLAEWQNTYEFQQQKRPLTIAEMDLRLSENPGTEPLPSRTFQVIKPGLDTVRHYVEYNWEPAELSFTHRVSTGMQNEPFTAPNQTVYQINERDSVLNKKNFYGHQVRSDWEGENRIVYTSEILTVQTVATQSVSINYTDEHTLSGREIMILLKDDYTSPFGQVPELVHHQIDGWDFFLPKQLVNTLSRGARGNILFILSPDKLYKVRITGGLISDISNFLNSLKINDRSLQFEYDEQNELKQIELH